MTYRNRISGHGEEAPDSFLANPENWRIHPRFQQDALEALLEDVGWVSSVLVNTVTGHLVDGHLRVMQAMKRGEPLVPVTYVELTIDEERLILSMLDPVAGLAGTHADKLAALNNRVEERHALLGQLMEDMLLRATQPTPLKRGQIVAKKKSILEQKVRLGAFVFTVPLSEYDAWQKKLVAEVGADGVLNELLRRLEVPLELD